MIQTRIPDTTDVYHDDITQPVKAQTIHELHSLQKKKSAPGTPIRSPFGGPFSDQERQRQQLQSIR